MLLSYKVSHLGVSIHFSPVAICVSTLIKKIFYFIYHAEVENGLIEHEYDHVFAGEYEGKISLNSEEVKDYGYRSIKEIKAAIQNEPANFTSWFRIVFPRIEKWWQQQYG